MKRCRFVLKKLLHPNALALSFLLAVSAAALPAVFIKRLEDTAFAYAAYVLSAYTLTAAALRIPPLTKKVRDCLHRNPWLHRYITEADFKAEVSLYLSLAINLFYSIYKGAAGIWFHSAWFGAMAFYYLVLSTERFLLLRSVRGKEQNPLLSWKKYRFCGYILLLLTVAVVAFVFYTIYEGHVIKYQGYIIYGAAGYTFYQFGFAIANLVKYRRLGNPVYSASKIIALATALVSTFSLQTAMLAAFGGNGTWQKQMNLWTGLGVLAAIVVMALFMIGYGTRAIRKGSG